MSIGSAMFTALLLLLFVGAIILAILGLVWLLIDHPIALFSIVTALLFILCTVYFYIGGNAA